MEVLNELGHGLHEKPYENALVVEFGLSSVPFLQQPHYEALYKGLKVGEYIPDLIAFGAIVVDARVVEAITDTNGGVGANHPGKGSHHSPRCLTLALIRVDSR